MTKHGRWQTTVDITPEVKRATTLAVGPVLGFGTKKPSANTVLTTAMDAWGRPWAPRSPESSSGLVRRPVMDSCGPGNSPEKRKVGGSTPPLTTILTSTNALRQCGDHGIRQQRHQPSASPSLPSAGRRRTGSKTRPRPWRGVPDLAREDMVPRPHQRGLATLRRRRDARPRLDHGRAPRPPSTSPSGRTGLDSFYCQGLAWACGRRSCTRRPGRRRGRS